MSFKDFLGLGIAGNFALHLEQAGEVEDFKDVITDDEAAPKGIFPFYLPCTRETDNERPREMLFTYPLSSDTLQLPQDTSLNIQAEPEVALICDLVYENDKLVFIDPLEFGAYNDASIRVAGAQKISDKKNWGANTKGVAQDFIPLDAFEEGGNIENYTICSFIRRNGHVLPYGENVKLTGYSYFYKKLLDWIINQVNTQEDFGPLEDVKAYIKACNNPKKLIISIGATRYTQYGESTYLEAGDEVLVAVYNHNRYSYEDIQKIFEEENYEQPALSILAQKVIR